MKSFLDINRYSYCVNNPLKYCDPTGWWTEGHGFNITIAFGIGFSFEVLKVSDDTGNSAWAISLGFIGGTSNAGGGYQYQCTNANSVDKLSGWSGGGGASTSYVPIPFPSGAEYIGYKRNQEDGWEGYNANVGPQVAPVEVHATVGYTWIIGNNNNVDNSSSESSIQLPISSQHVTTASPQASYPLTYSQSYNMTQTAYSDAAYQIFYGVSSGRIPTSTISTVGMSNTQAYSAYQSGQISYADYSTVILRSLG